MKCAECSALETQFLLENPSDLTDQALERQLTDQEHGVFLEVTDLPEGNSAR